MKEHRVEQRMETFRLADYVVQGKYCLKLYYDESTEHGFIPVNMIIGAQKGPTLLVLAGVHGDEYEGVSTILRLFSRFKPQQLSGKLVMIPIVNQSAYAGKLRESVVDGKNLARVFPGKIDGTYTEKLAYYLGEKFIKEADFMLDYHSAGSHYSMPALVGFLDESYTEVGKKSAAAAEAFGLPVIWGHHKVAGGRTVSFATEQNVPWLYVEGFGGKRIRKEEQLKYDEGLCRLLVLMEMIEERHLWNIRLQPFTIKLKIIGDGDLDQSITAEKDGFFVPEVELLDEVTIGQHVGNIYQSHGEVWQRVCAPRSGLVIMRRETPPVKQGESLIVLANISA